MKRFVIERDIPGVGSVCADELRATARASVNALRDLGPDVQWVQSHITSDRIYCVYLAENEEIVRAHAGRAGLPANRISEVIRIADPTTANGATR
jgi:hypothetical protein